jgi:hypothetical protein
LAQQEAVPLSRNGTRFFLYVEGPRDRGILRAWSYRMLPAAARRLFSDAVILGGRQPARALDHFRREVENGDAARALCVLDRDDGAHPHGVLEEPRLDFFTWSRRHIESYLLVPDAVRRALGRDDEDGRLLRLLRSHLPRDGDEDAWSTMDAKRLLGPGGLLPRALGRRIDLARIARATREPELHRDVHALFERLRGEVEGVEQSG